MSKGKVKGDGERVNRFMSNWLWKVYLTYIRGEGKKG